MKITRSSTRNFHISFHAYYPARGRKLHSATCGGGNASECFHAYYPARGRKPNPTLFSRSQWRWEAFTPITPQGDGNMCASAASTPFPQGGWSFHAYYPARGRKLLLFNNEKGDNPHNFHAYYPARGRKRCGTTIFVLTTWAELSRLLPRKGTETFKPEPYCLVSKLY